VQNRETPVLESTNLFHGAIKGKKPSIAREQRLLRKVLKIPSLARRQVIGAAHQLLMAPHQMSRQSLACLWFRPRIKRLAHARADGVILHYGLGSTAMAGPAAATCCRRALRSMRIAMAAGLRASIRRGSNGSPTARPGLAPRPFIPGDLVFVEVWSTSPQEGALRRSLPH
jgi:hypothetical protein